MSGKEWGDARPLAPVCDGLLIWAVVLPNGLPAAQLNFCGIKQGKIGAMHVHPLVSEPEGWNRSKSPENLVLVGGEIVVVAWNQDTGEVLTIAGPFCVRLGTAPIHICIQAGVAHAVVALSDTTLMEPFTDLYTREGDTTVRIPNDAVPRSVREVLDSLTASACSPLPDMCIRQAGGDQGHYVCGSLERGERVLA